MKRWCTTIAAIVFLAPAAALTAACGSGSGEPVTISGSATMDPINAIAARESRTPTDIETVGTHEGFARFCTGGVDITNASAPMPAGGEGLDDQQRVCAENDVQFVELEVGIDAISLVRNNAASFAGDLTMEELRAIWRPESDVRTWRDVRSDWPADEIVLLGRNTTSGTFTVFTEQVMGTAGQIRDDYRSTDSPAQLAAWVAENPNALAFMGIGNYLSAPEEIRNAITTISIDGTAPDAVNSADGSYPLARPLRMYVSTAALDANENVERYARYLLDNARSILPRAFFYPLAESAYAAQLQRLSDRTTGTA